MHFKIAGYSFSSWLYIPHWPISVSTWTSIGPNFLINGSLLHQITPDTAIDILDGTWWILSFWYPILTISPNAVYPGGAITRQKVTSWYPQLPRSLYIASKVADRATAAASIGLIKGTVPVICVWWLGHHVKAIWDFWNEYSQISISASSPVCVNPWSFAGSKNLQTLLSCHFSSRLAQALLQK